MASDKIEDQMQILNVMRNINNIFDQDKDNQTLKAISSFLSKTKLFQSIQDNEYYESMLHETSVKLKYKKYSYGEFLFHQGEIGDNLYFVLSGQGSVYIQKEEYEIKTDMNLHYNIDLAEVNPLKQNVKEEKNIQLKQMELIKQYEQSINNNEFINTSEIQSGQHNLNEVNLKPSSLLNQQPSLVIQSRDQNDDEITILAMNSKYQYRYFRISKEFSMYKRVRYERYLDHFGELAAEEKFCRRFASVVASSKNEEFEVAYINLDDFKQIFSHVFNKLYFVQNTFFEQLINCSKKQIINFSYLFNETIKFERGQKLFAQGTHVNGVFMVKKGTVSIRKHDSDLKQTVSLTILSPKDLFGHEDAFTLDMKRSISAVSESCGTEVSFAKIDDILDFLMNHKDFEKELKRKSDLKMNFYQKRIINVKKVFKDTQNMIIQREKRNNKIQIEDNQDTIFNKFLIKSREKLNLNKNVVRGICRDSKILDGSQQKLKKNDSLNQIIDASSFVRNNIVSTNDSKQQNKQLEFSSSNILADNTQKLQMKQNNTQTIAKSRNNIRTKSLISLNNDSVLDQNKNLIGESFSLSINGINEIQQQKKRSSKHNIEEGSINGCIKTPLQRKQSKLYQRQQTLSQHQNSKSIHCMEEVQILETDQIKNIGQSNQNRFSNSQSIQLNKKLSDITSGKNTQPQNWTLDNIEQKIKINLQNLQNSQNSNLNNNTYHVDNQHKLTYLHCEMDSFEQAKQQVIQKRNLQKSMNLRLNSFSNIQHQTNIQNYKRPIVKREEQTNSQINSPTQSIKRNDKILNVDKESIFFNPYKTIQKFSQYIQNQPSLKNIDFQNTSSSYMDSPPTLQCIQKFNSVERYSLSETNSPTQIVQTTSILNNNSIPSSIIFSPIQTALKQKKDDQTHNQIVQNNTIDSNQSNIFQNISINQKNITQQIQSEKISSQISKQSPKKMFQLRRCVSTIINSDDVNKSSDNEQQLINQDSITQSPIISLYQQLNNSNNQSSQNLVNQKIPKLIFEKLCLNQGHSENSNFKLTLSQKDEQTQLNGLNRQQNQYQLSNPLKINQNVNKQKTLQNIKETEESFVGDKIMKYYINTRQIDIDQTFSPIKIQKMSIQCNSVNQSSNNTPINNQQQNQTFQAKQVSSNQQEEKNEEVFSLNNNLNKNQISETQLPSQNLQSIQNQSLIAPVHSQQNHQQKFSPTKRLSSNLNVHSIKKQLINQNNALLRNHLKNKQLNRSVAFQQSNEKSSQQSIEIQEHNYSPIHHSSQSPSRRASQTQIPLSQCMKTTFSSLIGQQNSNGQDFSPLFKQLKPQQYEFRLSNDFTENKEENTSSHKADEINEQTPKIFKSFNPIVPLSSKKINLFRKHLFKKVENSKQEIQNVNINNNRNKLELIENLNYQINNSSLNLMQNKRY